MLPRTAAAALSLLCALAIAAFPTHAQDSPPEIQGPVSGGAGSPFIQGTSFDLSEVGYSQTEYFVSGTARSFTSATPLASDGRWSTAPDESAPYKTRIVVHRPLKRWKFNGSVIVEWLNVSGGLDASPDWTFLHTEITRRGYAWVGVSAQFVGVEGGDGLIPGLPSLSLKAVDPARYASLSHPGDSFSYDIYSQVAQALREPGAVDPLDGLRPKRILAVGESQSAFRMVSYINGVHPLHRLYDGFLVHSRGGSAAPLSQEDEGLIPSPSPAFVRDDLEEPVLIFQTETDLGLLGFLPDRQPDTDRIRLWEVAGTAHVDAYTTTVGPGDRGDSPDAMGVVFVTDVVPGIISCPLPVNSGPQHVVLKAALHALHLWIKRGRIPPTAPRLQVAGDPATIQRDALGNALGGVRTPWVDVPVAAHAGDGQDGSILCALFGTSSPLDPSTLSSLYPSHRAFRNAFARSAREARKAGFIRPRDASLMRRWARRSEIGD